MAPSFRYKLDESRRTKRWPLRPFFDKAAVYAIFDACRVSRPHVVATKVALSEVCQRVGADPVVIKPVGAHSGQGVVAITSLDVGKFRDLISGGVFSLRDLRDHLQGEMKRYRFSDAWVMEELLLTADDAIPPDVKVYAFRGRAGCILARSGSLPRKYRWFGPDLAAVSVGKDWYQIDRSLQPPSAKTLEIALGLSATLPVPFVRVDVYETKRGVVFGELTPYPGNYESFNSKWDQRLGALYEEAETELLARGVQWSRLLSRRLRRVHR